MRIVDGVRVYDTDTEWLLDEDESISVHWETMGVGDVYQPDNVHAVNFFKTEAEAVAFAKTCPSYKSA